MLLIRFLLAPSTAFAQRTLFMATGPRLSVLAVISNIVNFAAMSATGVFTLLFLTGAGMLTMSRGDQTKVDNGKKLMISSLIGLALVLGSYGIVRTVLYFLYEWAP